MNKKATHVHRLIAVTAIEMAHELYASIMTDNAWYTHWKNQHPGASPRALERLFVKRNVEGLVPQARATLAAMLGTNIDERQKEEIMECLVLDNTLRRGRDKNTVILQ